MLAKICPTFLIIGNHDMNVKNKSRPDTLSSILYMKKIPNVYLLRDSGIYRFRNLQFVVWSLTDDNFIRASSCPRIDGVTNVALHHGTVDGSRTHVGKRLGNCLLPSDFDGFDIVCLGDVHRYQELEGRPHMAYSGSLTTKTFGEVGSPHGFLVWDVEKRRAVQRVVENSYGRITFSVNVDSDGHLVFTPPLESCELPANGFFKLRTRLEGKLLNLAQIMIRDRTSSPIFDIELPSEVSSDAGPTTVFGEARGTDVSTMIGTTALRASALRQVAQVLEEYIEAHTLPEGVGVDDVVTFIDGELENTPYNASCGSWTPIRLEWSNLMTYGLETCCLDFEELDDKIIGITGDNRMGKSSIVDILCFVLYNKSPRCQTDMSNVLRKGQKTGHAKLILLDTSGHRLRITRAITQERKKVKSVVKIEEAVDDTWKDASDDQRAVNARICEVVGPYDAFKFLNFYLQKHETPLWSLSPADLRNFLASLLGIDKIFKECKVVADRHKANARDAKSKALGALEALAKTLPPRMATFTEYEAALNKEALEVEARLRSKSREVAAMQEAIDVNNRNLDNSVAEYTREQLEREERQAELQVRELADKLDKMSKAKERADALRQEARELDLLDRSAEICEEFTRREMAAMEHKATMYAGVEPANGDRHSELSDDRLRDMVKTNLDNIALVAGKRKEIENRHQEVRTTIRVLEVQKGAFGNLRPPRWDRPSTSESMEPLFESAEPVDRDLRSWESQLVSVRAQSSKYNPECDACLLNSEAVRKDQSRLEADIAELRQRHAVAGAWVSHDRETEKLQSTAALLEDARAKESEAKVEIELLGREMEALQSTVTGFQEVYNARQEAKIRESTTFPLYRKLRAQQERLKVINRELESIESTNYERVRAEHTEATERRSELQALKVRHSCYVMEMQKIKGMMENMKAYMKREIEPLDAKIRSLRHQLAECRSNLRKSAVRSAELKEHTLKFTKFEYVAQLVSDKGLMLFAMKTMLPRLSKEISNMIERYMDFRIELKYVNDKINTSWIRKDDGVTIDVHSGMEEFVGGIMTKMALSRLVHLPRANVFLIDEGISVFDGHHMESLEAFLRLLKQRFRTCFLITHIDVAKDTVDVCMEVTPLRTGGSTIVRVR